MMKNNYFRAWDEKEKIMLDGDFIEENYPTYTAGMSYGKLFVANHSDGEWYECIVMQATGRYDKNGRQVFEGDILAVPHFLDVNGWRYLHHVVEWSDKYSGWWCRNKTSDHDADGCIQFWVYAKKEFEIVGNIYESAESI
jgi:uncharacterized phage protein (TIGR01671 family)